MLLPALILLAHAQTPTGVPPNAQLIGPPMSHGTILYDEPEAFDETSATSGPISPEAVLAAQRVEIPLARRVSDRRIVTGAPFRIDLQAGAYFSIYRGPQGLQRCFQPVPMVAYEPPEDERGEIYPGRCLVDVDGDGAFETLRLHPYLARNRTRDEPIEPVRLLPAPAADDPRAPRYSVYRRLRIADVSDDGIVIVLEHAARALPDQPLNYRDRGPGDRITLPLRAGAEASIAGMDLRIEGRPGDWRWVARGSFENWVVLENDGAAVRAGPFYIAERED